MTEQYDATCTGCTSLRSRVVEMETILREIMEVTDIGRCDEQTCDGCDVVRDFGAPCTEGKIKAVLEYGSVSGWKTDVEEEVAGSEDIS